MPIRTTIHLPDPIAAILGDPPDPSLSGRLACIVAAYAHLCEAAGVGTGMDEAGARCWPRSPDIRTVPQPTRSTK